MRLVLVAAALALSAAGQLIPHVRNAADPLQQVLVPGSLVSVSIESLSLPAVILNPATTTVTIAGENVSVLGSDRQTGVTVLVPQDVPLGSTRVSIGYFSQGTHFSSVANFPTVDSQFGVYASGPGFGPAIAQQVPGWQTNGFLHPAYPGDYVSLWGTGLGAATPDQVAVKLGGNPANVVYAGPAPTLPGVDQINFQVPYDPAIPDSCFVALEVIVRGQQTNPVSLSKASSDGPCASVADLTTGQMAQLDAGGTVDFTSFQIYSAIQQQNDGSFARHEFFNALSVLTPSALFPRGATYADDVYFSCQSNEFSRAGIIAVLSNGPDLGPVMSLAGPSNSAAVPSSTPDLYTLTFPDGTAAAPDQMPPSYFAPGIWQVSAQGNAAVSPYQAQIAVPPAIQLTNYSNLLTIDSQKDLLIQWNPAGYASLDIVTLSLSLTGPFFTRQPTVCHAHAGDGQLSVPANLLQWPGVTGAALLITVQGPAIRADLPLISGSTLPGDFVYDFLLSFNAQVH